MDGFLDGWWMAILFQQDCDVSKELAGDDLGWNIGKW